MSLLFSTGVIAGSAAKGAPGLVLIKPSSIANSSGSATLGTNGQVSFTSVSTVSMNDVFSATYDAYVAYIRFETASTNIGVSMRVRAAGSDASGASTYTMQQMAAVVATITGSRSTDDKGYIGEIFTAPAAAELAIYNPYPAIPTSFRSITSGRANDGADVAAIRDYVTVHDVSTSYDGLTLLGNGGTMTGTVSVYGWRA